MGKNGLPFISVIDTTDFVSSVWDPYAYRHNDETEILAKFAEIHKLTTRSNPCKPSPFRAIEYRDIPGGSYLSFSLEKADEKHNKKLPSVGEGRILFGTMRAYLGNIIVTPLADWVNQEQPLYFSIKSEFVIVTPYDKLTYFWFAYMRSRFFLENLPVGTGGTRPRLQPGALKRMPVMVPSLESRTKIHQELGELAKEEWQNYSRTSSTIQSVNLLLEETY